VVTFTAPKLAHVSGLLTARWSEPVVVAPIGSPAAAVHSATGLHWAGSAQALARVPRPVDANKGQFGHVLVVGGSHGKSGAPAMASLAALRSGAGLVTAAVTESILPMVAAITPELMTWPLPESPDGSFRAESFSGPALDALLDRKTVVAAGPGLGQQPGAALAVQALLARGGQPLVLDADALNLVAHDLPALDAAARRRTIVLTPHPGEMARLAGLDTRAVQADREGVARRFAREHNVLVVLKGWRTLVAHPQGAIAVNTTGNPGMAKGGSGDILTGIVAAMLAQHSGLRSDQDPAGAGRAVEAAVYLHGLAADFALLDGCEQTLLATDTVAHLASAFRFEPEAREGYVWLQGLPRALRQRR